MGQLCEIAEVFYKLNNMTVRILESKNDNPGSTTSPLLLDTKTVFVKYRLDFDNRDYVSTNRFAAAYKSTEIYAHIKKNKNIAPNINLIIYSRRN